MAPPATSRAADEFAHEAAILNQAALILRRRSCKQTFALRVIIRFLERTSGHLVKRAENA
jgi:hypothetical protein